MPRSLCLLTPFASFHSTPLPQPENHIVLGFLRLGVLQKTSSQRLPSPEPLSPPHIQTTRWGGNLREAQPSSRQCEQ